MTRAEQAAVEKYPHGTFDGELGDSLRYAFIAGYNKAEKELDFGEEGFVRFTESVKALVDAVEGYIAPNKGDKYVFRNEVLAKCNKVKKLLEK